MNKKLKTLVATFVISAFIIPVSYVNAKPYDNVKDVNTKKVDLKDKNNKEKDKNTKQLENMLKVITKRLDSIEKETSKINDKISSYFSTGESNSEDTDGESQVENPQENKDITESTEPSESGQATLEGTEATEATVETTQQDGTTNNETVEASEDTTKTEETEKIEETTEATEDAEEAEDATDEEEQKEIDEIEEDFKDEDNSRYNSFYGKLNAELNKLNSVVNKLNSLGNKYGKDNTELKKAYDRVNEIKEKINTIIGELDSKQKEVVSSVRNDKNKKVLETKKDISVNKTWAITFTKELDPTTVNGENVVVSDGQGNVVAVDISYNTEKKQIVIECKEGFKSGTTYYLNLSTNLKSVQGNNLSEPIEMGFTIK